MRDEEMTDKEMAMKIAVVILGQQVKEMAYTSRSSTNAAWMVSRHNGRKALIWSPDRFYWKKAIETECLR